MTNTGNAAALDDKGMNRSTPAMKIGKAAVLGAGTMGAGIASAARGKTAVDIRAFSSIRKPICFTAAPNRARMAGIRGIDTHLILVPTLRV